MRIYPYFVSSHLMNQYLVVNYDRGEALLIDAPDFDEHIIATIEENRIKLKAILITHSHDAHIRNIEKIYKIYSPRTYAYSDRSLPVNAIKVRDKSIIREAGLEIKCYHVPGHSMDSVCYHTESALFSGDTLLSGCIGKTNTLVEKELLVKSIKEKILSLDEKTIIYPGHGSLTKVRVEKLFNQDILDASISIFS